MYSIAVSIENLCNASIESSRMLEYLWKPCSSCFILQMTFVAEKTATKWYGTIVMLFKPPSTAGGVHIVPPNNGSFRVMETSLEGDSFVYCRHCKRHHNYFVLDTTGRICDIAVPEISEVMLCCTLLHSLKNPVTEAAMLLHLQSGVKWQHQ